MLTVCCTAVHHANHYYGHSHVLARYCGLDDREPPRLAGYLQHGWNIGDGLAADHEFVAGTPVFLWSERTRRRAWSLGRRETYVIGSPLAYLLAMQPAPPPARTGTIWYPFHGWEGQHVLGDHANLIAQIKETEEGPVTACLYWQEFRDSTVRRRYEQAGFRVICHGYRGGWWQDLDPDFLDRQLKELLAHRRVASNRLCSAVFYGTLAGCEPAVYGDPMVLDKENMTYGGQARIRRQWPEMHGEQVNLAEAQATTVAELGADRLLPPAELRQLFRWTEPDLAARTATPSPTAPPPVALSKARSAPAIPPSGSTTPAMLSAGAPTTAPTIAPTAATLSASAPTTAPTSAATPATPSASGPTGASVIAGLTPSVSFRGGSFSGASAPAGSVAW